VIFVKRKQISATDPACTPNAVSDLAGTLGDLDKIQIVYLLFPLARATVYFHKSQVESDVITSLPRAIIPAADTPAISGIPLYIDITAITPRIMTAVRIWGLKCMDSHHFLGINTARHGAFS
jgi:hypothetical protein